MTQGSPPIAKPRSRVAATLKALVRARITAGLLVVLPIWVTVLLVRFVFGAMRDASLWAVLGALENTWFQEHVFKIATPNETLEVEQLLRDHPYLDWGLAVFSVLLTILLLYAIGLFAANFFGRRIIGWLETLVDKVPLVKTVYRSCKQILNTLAGGQAQSFQRVALVPFPNELTRSVGFITNNLTDAVTGDELCSIFIPTTPNPTTGFVFVLKRADIIEVNWSVEEAIKVIMSGGLLSPDYVTMVVQAARRPGSAAGEVHRA